MDSVDVVDEGLGDFAFGAPGTIATFYGSAVFGSNFQIATSLNASDPDSIFQTIQFSVDSNAAGTLTLAISEQNLDITQLSQAFLGIGGTTTSGGSVSFAAYIDAGNALFGTGTTLFSGGPLTDLAFSELLSGALDGLTDPFSVTLEVVITHTGAGITTGNAQLTLLPEPMTTALLGLGLLGAGLMRRRAR
ncbi:MAG: PEP-CTERM sorting domain-containing protein [Alphaproteobacteria bacterium]|nr:PEP-CTERM sorting domain-containing protein [Alphaproteobacteria bacterium]